MDNDVREPSEWVTSKEGRDAQVRLWDETVEILSKVDARISSVDYPRFSALDCLLPMGYRFACL